jgi:hypothetical protein
MLSTVEIVFGKGRNISWIPILQLLSQLSTANILCISQLSFGFYIYRQLYVLKCKIGQQIFHETHVLKEADNSTSEAGK